MARLAKKPRKGRYPTRKRVIVKGRKGRYRPHHS
jgi:hypothetical protein